MTLHLGKMTSREIATWLGLSYNTYKNNIAKYLVFNTFSYVTGENEQMQDRIHRIGQTKDVEIFYQIFNNTQYQRMWDIVMRKQMIINAVIKIIAINGESFKANIIINDKQDIKDNPVDNPSNPSIKFIALVIPTIHTTVNPA